MAVVQRKVNAPRLKWPPMFSKEGQGFSAEYRQFTEDMAVCYDLVDIAKFVLNRPDLQLIAGGERDGILRAATDGTKIYLPKMHPNRRVVTKHELAHIYFNSDIPLRLRFVKKLIKSYEQRSRAHFHPDVREQLTDDLCFIINIFDDIRVNSLWGLLYPGDGRDMEEWYTDTVGPEMAKSAADTYDNDVSHLFTYMILVLLGQEVASTKWGKFRPAIEEIKSKVTYVTFKALLLAVRALLERIIEDILQDPPPAAQSQQPAWGGSVASNGGSSAPEPPDIVTALSGVQSAPRPPAEFDNDNADFDHRKDVPNHTPEQEADAQQAVDAPLDDDSVDQTLDAAEEAQFAQVQEIRARLSQSQGHDKKHERTRRVLAKVEITKVRKMDVVPYDMAREDLEVAKQWRRNFHKVIGTMRKRVSPEGYELITPLYIHQRLNGQPLVCYRRPQSGRGFRLAVLIDLSGSMYNKFAEVERLYAVLNHALDFPFVHMEVLGFYSGARGVVNIVQYAKGVQGLVSGASHPGGMTPLSHAIQFAGQGLMRCRHESHLFVISDGAPEYLPFAKDSGKPKLPRAVLVNWVGDAVTELRRARVNTYCFMLGHEASAQDMNVMFGEASWKRLETDTLFRDAFAFVREQFLRYLRTR